MLETKLAVVTNLSLKRSTPDVNALDKLTVLVADDLKACFGNTPSPEHGLYRRHVYLQQANGRRIVHDRHANVIVPRELTGYWDAHGPL